MKKILIILSGIGVFISCNNDDENSVINQRNFLIFGHFYGQCVGEGCVETFKLTDNGLFEDTIDDYSGDELKFEELDMEKFEQVKNLVDFFPNQLLKDNNNVFGCPDCADGGGLFIKYAKDGEVRSWSIDQNKSNVPTYMHNFIDKVNEKIGMINNE